MKIVTLRSKKIFCNLYLKLFILKKALTLTLLFTMPDSNIQDTNTMSILNEYYTIALLYEFDINRRDFKFITEFKSVIKIFKYDFFFRNENFFI